MTKKQQIATLAWGWMSAISVTVGGYLGYLQDPERLWFLGSGIAMGILFSIFLGLLFILIGATIYFFQGKLEDFDEGL